MIEFLKQKATELEIDISDSQLHQFQLFYEHMIEVNQVMNLTAITDEKEIVIKHFIDSISILKYFEMKNDSSVIDVGTGAGFPGIPLAIMLPNIHFTLMDSLNKRLKFLDDVLSLCQIHNVSLVHSRAEDLGNDVHYREQYDYCVSRAVANLSVLLEYCTPFIKVGGKFISYKATLAEEELKKSKTAQKKLSCHLEDEISFELSSEEYQRCYLSFCKDSILSKKYPRQAGIPKKNPL